jgi:very-short-patch-repair endonuclease/ligand-binding SRPBCC domain-containing protein
VSNLQSLAEARATVGDLLSEAGWSVDLTEERKVLAAHGTSFFRIFNSQWRAANRTVRSYLTHPKLPLERQLVILDAQTRARGLLTRLEEESGFGQAAFGTAWRGQQTPIEPAQALVDWMRSLKGLGAEPRIIAGRSPDKVRLGDLARATSNAAEPVRGQAGAMWDDLRQSRADLLPGSGDPLTTDLKVYLAASERIATADRTEKAISVREESNLSRRLDDLKLLVEGQQLAAAVVAAADLGRAAFGADWRDDQSDWTRLSLAAGWIGNNLDIHQLAARLPHRTELSERAAELASARDILVSDVEKLLVDMQAGDDCLPAPGTVSTAELSSIEQSLAAWKSNGEQLSKWVAYRTRAARANSLGLSDLVSRLHVGELRPSSARAEFEMAYFETVLRDQVAADPALGEFDGDLHNRLVQTFTELDKQRIRHSALEVVRAHHRTIPPRVGGKVGPLGVLRSEMARKRGHMPIRQLMQKAAPAVQALKPVFMMSPLSVAQFLQPGCLEFDLLVMDEASQIQPVDALGAIARCKQVVVVGDPQQLPPTAFFSKVTGTSDAADDDDGTARVADIESILGLFTARGLPMRMLRWHYRSRHESLIAVSNRQFYENKLFIVPSPYTAQAGLGLRFHHVTNGIFETGTTRTNPVEAKTVAQAIIDHAINHPELSLGVVAFSAAQRRAILDQLELLRRALPPEQEAFFQAHAAEPFFVKNLENVQGDERDVIFISVGYGPTALGLKPPMRFGPLGQDGGERRLNVLISRAKRRTEIFSSMTDEDIEPDFASSRKGVFAFKMFMHFARTGRMTMAEATARDHESVFEAQVAEALHARGYQVHRQVGLAGFFIDLAIADPECADRYLLGIECDGAAYHEARSARDRDRLRQAILEDHGWNILRIWSTDWFRRPLAELDRVVAAIEAAKVELTSRKEREERARPARLEIVSVDREDVTEMGLVATDVPDVTPAAYVEAKLSKPGHLFCDLHDAPTGILTQLAEQVVAIEGPVHIDEIINRIRDAWGLRRAGGRIQDAVEKAVAVAVRQNRLLQDGDFYNLPHKVPIVRDRCTATSATLRKPETLPPAEIRLALLQVIERNFGATEDQVVQAAARAFGFKSTSALLRDVIVETLRRMLAAGELHQNDGLLTIGPNAPASPPPAPEPTPLERLIGLGETDQVEFKQTLRWDVRQQTINRKLEDVVVKTIAALGNHVGGTLLIGVCDDGTVSGLEADLATFNGSRDRLELHLTELLNTHLPKAFRAMKVRTTFPELAGHVICRVDVERSRQPLFVTIADGQGVKAERLFIRSGNSSHEVPPSQIPSFVRERFEFQG